MFSPLWPSGNDATISWCDSQELGAQRDTPRVDATDLDAASAQVLFLLLRWVLGQTSHVWPTNSAYGHPVDTESGRLKSLDGGAHHVVRRSQPPSASACERVTILLLTKCRARRQSE